jgi:hypothetical protein
MAFRRGDLAKATALLFTKFETETHGEQYIRPAHVAKQLMKDGITPKDMDACYEALKKMGMVK